MNNGVRLLTAGNYTAAVTGKVGTLNKRPSQRSQA